MFGTSEVITHSAVELSQQEHPCSSGLQALQGKQTKDGHRICGGSAPKLVTDNKGAGEAWPGHNSRRT